MKLCFCVSLWVSISTNYLWFKWTTWREPASPTKQSKASTVFHCFHPYSVINVLLRTVASIMECEILAIFNDDLKHRPMYNKNSGKNMFFPLASLICLPLRLLQNQISFSTCPPHLLLPSSRFCSGYLCCVPYLLYTSFVQPYDECAPQSHEKGIWSPIGEIPKLNKGL